MRLFLMRHGDYVPPVIDPQKPLSPQGANDVRRVAQYFKGQGSQIEIFYHSDKRRARETAVIMREVVNPKAPLVMKDGLAPDDPIKNAYEMIAEERSLMIVGHAPFMPALAEELLGHRCSVSMPTATVITLEKKNDQWMIIGRLTPQEVQ